jgi:hypothetical protein
MRPHFLRRPTWKGGWDKTKFTNTTLKPAVIMWCESRATRHKKAIDKHGHIRGWDVSGVTNMDHLFCNKRSFNDDISGWDVSKVVSMISMFQNAVKFNQPLGAWVLSPEICKNRDRSMFEMFKGATNFTSPKPNEHFDRR